MPELTKVTPDVISTNTISGLISAGFTSMNVATMGTQTIDFGSSNTLVFRANTSTERMRITTDGNVGIGTSTPVRGLTVYKAGASSRILIQSDVTGQAINRGFDVYLDQANNAGVWNYQTANLIFGTSNTERMCVDSGGNVGIGTSSPGYRLDVKAATAVTRIQSTTGTNEAYLNVNNTGGDLYVGRDNSAGTGFGGSAYAAILYSSGAYPMQFYTNATERMRIANTGNIGIGTASPVTRLQVAGTTRIDGNIEANANPFVYSWSGGTTGQVRSGIQFDGTNTLMSFYTATNERMRITSDGNVGIGTSSPGSGVRLDVLGGEIRAGRVDSSSEGGQVSFSRSSDNATAWYLDVFGNTSTPSFRVVDVSAGAVSMAINSSGAVALRGAVSATGVGITFPATQSASSDANTLDDYEEGTWTPVESSGAGLTLTQLFGNYVKIGQMVFVTMTFAYPITGNTGNALITGLPFQIASGGDNGAGAGGWGYISSGPILQIHTQVGGTGFRFYNLGTAILNNNISGVIFRGGFVYRAAA